MGTSQKKNTSSTGKKGGESEKKKKKKPEKNTKQKKKKKKKAMGAKTPRPPTIRFSIKEKPFHVGKKEKSEKKIGTKGKQIRGLKAGCRLKQIIEGRSGEGRSVGDGLGEKKSAEVWLSCTSCELGQDVLY